MIADAVVAHDRPEVAPLSVALVNNMPESAFLETERQFRRVLSSGPGGSTGIALELYTIDSIPRSTRFRADVSARYGRVEDLRARPPDALIVTGTEPVHANLVDEPFWPAFTDLLEWAAATVPTVMLSCLAAHASFLVFDGIERVRRPVKCSGVFDGAVEPEGDPIAMGLPRRVPIPHSRLHEIPRTAIETSGYRVVVAGEESGAGWAVAARERGSALFVLCQGHPEYSTLSLLREYRRDVRRHLFGAGNTRYPLVPAGYLRQAAVDALEEFRAWATHSRRSPEVLWRSFPYDEVAESVDNTWALGSSVLYANWLRVARLASAARV